MSGRLSDFGGHLDARCSVANGRYSFALRIEVRIPCRGVHQLAFVRINAWIFWYSELVEMAYRCDQEVEVLASTLSSSQIFDLDSPFGFFRLPVAAQDLRPKPSLGVDVVLAGYGLPVSAAGNQNVEVKDSCANSLQDLGTGGILLGPLCVGSERRF